MPPKLELVQEWLRIARRDLESARQLFVCNPPLLEPACFHAQQTVEKALKAILIFREQRPPRTHNLEDLFGLCELWMPGLAAHEESCAWLTSCAVKLRYPEAPPEVTPALAEDALKSAEAVFQFVVSQLPPEVRP